MTTSIFYPRAAATDGSLFLMGDGTSHFLFTNSISDADFLQWLRTQDSNIALGAVIKYGYQKAGLPAEGSLYFCDRLYTSEVAGTTTQFSTTIANQPTFSRSLDATQLGGRGVASVDSLSFDNEDHKLDYLLTLILDGRDVEFRLGDPSWEWSQWRQVGLASATTIKADDDSTLTLPLTDKGLLLDATIIGDTMLTGPNIGKPKPVLFGQNFNFDLTPYLFDQTGPSYYFNNYAQDPAFVVANVIVRDQGVSLINSTGFSGDNSAITANAGTDTITRVAHGQQAGNVLIPSGTSVFAGLTLGTQYYVLAAGLTADNFKLSLTPSGSAVDITGTTFSGTLAFASRRYYVNASGAYVTLSSPPNGQVTADILSQGLSGDSAIQNIPHAGFRYIIINWTKLTLANLDTAAFTNLVAAEQSDGVQWGIAILDRTNVLDVLDKIAILTNSYYGWNMVGMLTAGQLDLVNLDSQAYVDTIVEGDIVGEPSYENLPLQFGKLIVDSDANVVTQPSGLATSVSAQLKSLYSQAYQNRVKTTDVGTLQYPVDPWNYHLTALDSQPLETAYVGSVAQTQLFCDARTALFAPYTALFSCTVGLDKYKLDLNSVVLLKYPYYGLSGGVRFRVLGVKMHVADRGIDLILVRQNIPNYNFLGSAFTVPDAPTIGTATAKNMKASVTFTAPAHNGGNPITSYTATATPGGITVSGTASPLTLTGLSNGTPYTITVHATNLTGSGVESAASNSVTPATSVPDAPTTTAATVTTITSATVTFVAPVDNGGSAVTGYTVTSLPAGGTDSNAGSTGLSHVITGLTSGTAYTFTVHATNANGNSAESVATNSVTPGNRQIALVISSSVHTSYNIFTAASSPGDVVDVTLTINSGCDVDCQSVGTYALYGGNGWAAGSTLKIINNGSILGLGGTGAASGANGGDGQCAIYMTVPTTIDNTSGNIFGGGGGGGGGNGGGGGSFGGPAGFGGGGGAGYGQRSAYDAGYGDRLTGGAAGNAAGAGGNTAQSGAAGDGGAGGQPGNAILLNGNAITWIAGNNGTQVKGAVS